MLRFCVSFCKCRWPFIIAKVRIGRKYLYAFLGTLNPSHGIAVGAWFRSHHINHEITEMRKVYIYLKKHIGYMLLKHSAFIMFTLGLVSVQVDFSMYIQWRKTNWKRLVNLINSHRLNIYGNVIFRL